MEALIFCSMCGSVPASGTWSYQNVGGINKPVCDDCNEDLQTYMKKPFFEQLDVIDELLAEANKDLNNESLNQEAAQPTTPRNSGESKATNE